PDDQLVKKKELLIKKAKWVLIIILCYAFLGFICIPLITGWIVPDKLSQILKREVNIENISFNPFVFSASVEGFKVKDTDGEVFISFEKFYVNIQLISLMKFFPVIKEAQLISPYARVMRDDKGFFNFNDLIASPDKKSEKVQETDKKEIPGFLVEHLLISSGNFFFIDKSAKGIFQNTIDDFQLDIKNVSSSPEIQSDFFIKLKTKANEEISARGDFNIVQLSANGIVEIMNVYLPKYAPYYSEFINFNINDGRTSIKTDFAYHTDNETDTPELTCTANFNLSAFKLNDRKNSEQFLSIPGFSIFDAVFDLKAKSLIIDKIITEDCVLLCRRDDKGVINLSTLIPPKNNPDPDLKTDSSESKKDDSNPFQFKLKQFLLKSYSVRWEDNTPADDLSMELTNINVKAENISNQKNDLSNLEIAMNIDKKGRLSIKGKAGIEPLMADLDVKINDFEIKPLQPYISENVEVLITDGKVNVEGKAVIDKNEKNEIRAGFSGESSIVNLASVDQKKAENFFKFSLFNLSEINIDYNPTAVKIGSIALKDFYSRIEIDENGMLNVNSIVKKSPDAKPDEKKPDEKKPGEKKPGEKKPDEKRQGEHKKDDEQTAKVSGASQDENENFEKTEDPVLPIEIGSVILNGGEVFFSDYQVKPVFSTNLKKLEGKITELSSQLNVRSDVKISGKWNDQAPITIIGKINPLAKKMFVDLALKFNNIEMSPFSPYTGKYLGYKLQKGKTFLNLGYVIKDNKISAANNLVLDQFTLGEKVESKDATNLPVSLAIALIKDRNGKIEIDLPIKGKLDDPEFNFGKTLVKTLVNLITKIVTSPFTMLGSVFGGGDELSFVEFESGKSNIDKKNMKKLNSLKKALYERPVLKLDIEGAAYKEKDSIGIIQKKFHALLKTEKRKNRFKNKMEDIPLEQISIKKDEYSLLLTAAYNAAEIPESAKKDASVKTKKLSPEEMEKLLKANIKVNIHDLKELANERALNLKEYLLDDKKIEGARVFSLDPVLELNKNDKKLKYTHVNFKLR
ncbi:DUF748 domain-containing protein, partial [Desulfobacterales bacterium HSG16]|nr:DUF748 domain-containing protein [Desulfobacterales bacterium HSG16]